MRLTKPAALLSDGNADPNCGCNCRTTYNPFLLLQKVFLLILSGFYPRGIKGIPLKVTVDKFTSRLSSGLWKGGRWSASLSLTNCYCFCVLTQLDYADLCELEGYFRPLLERFQYANIRPLVKYNRFTKHFTRRPTLTRLNIYISSCGCFLCFLFFIFSPAKRFKIQDTEHLRLSLV